MGCMTQPSHSGMLLHEFICSHDRLQKHARNVYTFDIKAGSRKEEGTDCLLDCYNIPVIYII